jgi:deazaflavin-dependent oxidoreductase (nitroreductase family)
MLKETAPFRDVVRSFNKRVLNPAMLHLAGRKHWYAAVIRHTGRRSGRHYATPVVAIRINDEFIVPLPYGTAVDWLCNVEASGQAAISVGGQTWHVAQPEIIDAATAGKQLPPSRRRVFQRIGIDNFLRVKVTEQSSPSQSHNQR